MPNKKELRVSLDDDLIKKLTKIKEYYGIKNTTEIIRLLITEKFRSIEGSD
ncbi:MAG: ribbon-helix-helix protein, CopG family [Promethearchaeota archaeon]